MRGEERHPLFCGCVERWIYWGDDYKAELIMVLDRCAAHKLEVA